MDMEFDFGIKSCNKKTNENFPTEEMLSNEIEDFSLLKDRNLINLKEDIIPTKSVITNNLDFPELIYRRACKKSYNDETNAYITASQLGSSKKQFAFKKIYSNAQITDVSYMMDSMMGTAYHAFQEEIEDEAIDLVEIRFSTYIEGILFSAQLDHYLKMKYR